MPGLPSVLREMGQEGWIPWIYIGLPIGSIVSPMILGVLSDGKIAANKLCGIMMFAGGCTMTIAFGALHLGARIEQYVFLMFVNALISAPLWALSTQSALSYLKGQEERFAYYRVLGTIGWLAAGMIGGMYLGADSSATAGLVGGILRFPAAALCFLMPYCPPVAKKKGFSVMQMLGQGSRQLWGDPNLRVLYIASGLIAIPLASFFMYVPLMMGGVMEVEQPTTWMSLSQWFEIPGMLTLAWACRKFALKKLVAFGLIVTALRQFLFALAAYQESLWPVYLGLLTHGLTYSYFLTVAQVHMEQWVSPELRGRAQGMLSLIFGGIGNLFGVLIVGRLFTMMVDLESNEGWVTYWSVLSLMAVVPVVFYLARYDRGQKKQV